MTPQEETKAEGLDSYKNKPSSERLSILKKEIQSIKEKEEKAEKDTSYTWLNELLSFMRFVLKNNPSKEEIIFIRNFLVELKFNKDAAKIELNSLKDEKQLVDEIKIMLSALKAETLDGNSNDNKTTIENKLKENWGEARLDMIFIWAETDLVKQASSMLYTKIEERLSKYKLNQYELNNIAIWITKKMLDSWVLAWLAGWLNWKISTMSGKLANKDYFEFLAEFDESKKWSDDITKKIETLIDTNLKPIKDKLEERPEDKAVYMLFKNPKAIAEFKWWKIADWIEKIQTSDLVDFLSSANWQILSLDQRLLKAEKLKDDVLDMVSTAPWFVQEWLFKILKFFLDLPMIWEMIKGLLGKTWTTEEVLNWISEEIIMRKSVNTLKTFALKFDKNWNSAPSTKDPWIEILKDKDLRKVNIKRLKWFFDFCKNKWIDTNEKKFWINIFSDAPIFKAKDAEWKEIDIKINKLNIRWEDFEKNGEVKDSFFKELNMIKEVEAPKEKPKDDKAPTTPTVQSTVPPASVAAAPKKHGKPSTPKTPEKTGTKEAAPEYPLDITFNKGNSEALIDGQKYKVSIRDKDWNSIKIDNLVYNKTEHSLLLTWSIFMIQWTETFSSEQVKEAFIWLRQSWKYQASSKDKSKTLYIERV